MELTQNLKAMASQATSCKDAHVLLEAANEIARLQRAKDGCLDELFRKIQRSNHNLVGDLMQEIQKVIQEMKAATRSQILSE